MEKKNVNVLGWTGLILALLALAAVIVACIPMTPLEPNPSVKFFGVINVGIARAAIFISIAAIVVGAISCKNKDKKGPRKAGWIIGIFMLLAAMISTAVLAMFSEITAYINHEPNNALEQSFKDDPESKAQMDEFIDALLNGKLDELESKLENESKTESKTENDTESKTENKTESNTESTTDNR